MGGRAEGRAGPALPGRALRVPYAPSGARTFGLKIRPKPRDAMRVEAWTFTPV